MRNLKKLGNLTTPSLWLASLALTLAIGIGGAAMGQTTQATTKPQRAIERKSTDGVDLPDVGKPVPTKCEVLGDALGKKPEDVFDRFFSSDKSQKMFASQGCKDKLGEWFALKRFGGEVVFFNLEEGLISGIAIWWKPAPSGVMEKFRKTHGSDKPGDFITAKFESWNEGSPVPQNKSGFIDKSKSAPLAERMVGFRVFYYLDKRIIWLARNPRDEVTSEAIKKHTIFVGMSMDDAVISIGEKPIVVYEDADEKQYKWQFYEPGTAHQSGSTVVTVKSGKITSVSAI